MSSLPLGWPAANLLAYVGNTVVTFGLGTGGLLGSKTNKEISAGSSPITQNILQAIAVHMMACSLSLSTCFITVYGRSALSHLTARCLTAHSLPHTGHASRFCFRNVRARLRKLSARANWAFASAVVQVLEFLYADNLRADLEIDPPRQHTTPFVRQCLSQLGANICARGCLAHLGSGAHRRP